MKLRFADFVPIDMLDDFFDHSGLPPQACTLRFREVADFDVVAVSEIQSLQCHCFLINNGHKTLV
jgi:hypothetical protein